MINQVFSTIDVTYGTYDWLRREVMLQHGFTADHKLLGKAERTWIDSIVERGMHQFVNAAWPTAQALPETTVGEGREPDAQHVEAEKEARRRPPHRWSFTHRIHTLTTAIGTYEYEMPDDFGGVIGEPTTTREGGRIAIVRENHIRQLVESDAESGKPRYCALRHSRIGGVEKQQTNLLLYPNPDAIESISVEYSANPETLSDDAQYPPGGVEHAETLLAYCLMILAERSGKGLQEAIARVQDRLTASIVLDRASDKPTADGVWLEDDGRFNVAYLSRMIGRHIGAGPNPKVWTHQQEQLIAEIIRRARRRVYNPPAIRNDIKSHDWSFLRPIGNLTTVSGQWAYDLPADYVQMYGPVFYEGGGTIQDGSGNDIAVGTTFYHPLQMRGEADLMRMLQLQEASTRPTICATRVKKFNKAQGTRYELLVWAVPDGSYPLQFRYRVNPDTSVPNSLPAMVADLDLHGGDRYSEMYLEAAMLDADYLAGKKRSEHEDRFLRAVETAVMQDRATYASDNLGYNRDRRSNAEDQYGGLDRHSWSENITTFNGNTY